MRVQKIFRPLDKGLLAAFQRLCKFMQLATLFELTWQRKCVDHEGDDLRDKDLHLLGVKIEEHHDCTKSKHVLLCEPCRLCNDCAKAPGLYSEDSQAQSEAERWEMRVGGKGEGRGDGGASLHGFVAVEKAFVMNCK